MKFTTIIPIYNRGEDLQELLNSIFQQTFLPDEIIIIDDGELN
jgi:glycosyltransferase involved in cell wall biosynthesis